MLRGLLGSIRYFANLPARRADAIRAQTRLDEIEARLAALEGRGGETQTKLDLILEHGHILARRQIDYHRQTDLLVAQLGLPPPERWPVRLVTVEDQPGTAVFDRSMLCRQDSFEQPYFAYWAGQIGSAVIYHRKLWEFVYILQALWERGAIVESARGLGFGVGSEPLTAWFAARGCRITATDMAPEAAAAAGWSATQQHAAGKAALARPEICPPDLFDANVEFRVCDMNTIPDDLTGYDFCWSACALEHLGSIEHGLAFIQRSLDTLKPGGLAVHTTEFNVSSDSDTLSEGATVLFRARDMVELMRRLTEAGHEVAPLDLDPGFGPVDRYLDVPPYRQMPHLKLALSGYATTSIGLIVRKG